MDSPITRGGDQLRAGGRGYAANTDGDGECELPGGADGRGPERGGGGVERHDGDACSR